MTGWERVCGWSGFVGVCILVWEGLVAGFVVASGLEGGVRLPVDGVHVFHGFVQFQVVWGELVEVIGSIKGSGGMHSGGED